MTETVTVTNPPSEPVKVQGHNLQIDPDGVIRDICNVDMTPNGTTRCWDKTCKNTRAIKGVEYIRQNNLIINNDGTIVNSDSYDLRQLIYTTQLEVDKISGQLSTAKWRLDELNKQFKEQLTKERAEREAKEKYEQAQKEKALARVRKQLETLSTDRVAQLVVEGGLDRLGPVGQPARTVLTEAYNTIQSSYWIKSNEVQIGAALDNPWQVPAGLEKYIPVKNSAGKYTAITGVCSVGALALAKAVLNDIPVEAFSAMASGDRGMALATEALAWSLREFKGAEYGVAGDARGMIINWNDQGSTERDEVLQVWAKSLECPFLDLGDEDKLYYIACSGWASYKGAVTASKEEAEEAVRQLKENTTQGDDGYVGLNDNVTSPLARAVLTYDKAPVSYRDRYHVEELLLPTATLATV